MDVVGIFGSVLKRNSYDYVSVFFLLIEHLSSFKIIREQKIKVKIGIRAMSH